ncbi:hypothetical protein CF326_g9049, partial [Tilletia indica]
MSSSDEDASYSSDGTYDDQDYDEYSDQGGLEEGGDYIEEEQQDGDDAGYEEDDDGRGGEDDQQSRS